MRTKTFLLVLGSLIATLFLALPIFLRPTERRPLVKFDLEAIKGGLLSYWAEYGNFPELEGMGVDEINQNLASVLLAQGPEEHLLRTNKRHIRFVSFPNSRLKQGRFVDPWGHPYHFMYLTNLTKRVDRTFTPGAKIVVWSNGINGVNEYGLGDDHLLCVP